MESRIQKIRTFIASCPLIDKFTTDVHIDWTDVDAGDYGIMPTGDSIIQTVEDICGNKIRHKQSNFALYATRFTVDDIVRLESAGFLEDFSDWIEDQVQAGSAPKFGDDPDNEEMTAQNGMLFQLSPDGRTGLYQIQIQCFYEKHYTHERTDL